MNVDYAGVIELTYPNGDGKIHRKYALTADVLAHFNAWKSAQPAEPSHRDLNAWLAFNGGKLHCLTGPAEIRYDAQNRVTEEGYYKDNKFHRALEDGAAIIYYDYNGKPFGFAYYVEGAKMAPPAPAHEAAAAHPPKRPMDLGVFSNMPQMYRLETGIVK